jgi:hypothetical protein
MYIQTLDGTRHYVKRRSIATRDIEQIARSSAILNRDDGEMKMFILRNDEWQPVPIDYNDRIVNDDTVFLVVISLLNFGKRRQTKKSPRKSAGKKAPRKSAGKKAPRKSAGKKAPRKNAGKIEPSKSETYKVKIEFGASPSQDEIEVTNEMLSNHLKKYYSPTDISELFEYGRKDLLTNMKLSGVTLTLEVPKDKVKEYIDVNSASDLKRHIETTSLADGSWGGGTSNFFLMKDDNSSEKYPPELATISPRKVTVV